MLLIGLLPVLKSYGLSNLLNAYQLTNSFSISSWVNIFTAINLVLLLSIMDRSRRMDKFFRRADENVDMWLIRMKAIMEAKEGLEVGKNCSKR